MTNFRFSQIKRSSGWVEVICGGMFCGKTEELIRRVRRAAIAKQSVMVFKPVMDDRYAPELVNAHSGVTIEALRARHAAEVVGAVEARGGVQVVAIDEVQFFDDEIVTVVQRLADAGKRVICTGLDLDFRGEPFGLIPRLMAVAEHVDKLQAICLACGAAATRTQRLIDGRPANYHDPVIMIGADEAYEARCRACHVVVGRPVAGVPGAARAGETEELKAAPVVTLPAFRGGGAGPG